MWQWAESTAHKFECLRQIRSLLGDGMGLHRQSCLLNRNQRNQRQAGLFRALRCQLDSSSDEQLQLMVSTPILCSRNARSLSTNQGTLILAWISVYCSVGSTLALKETHDSTLTCKETHDFRVV